MKRKYEIAVISKGAYARTVRIYAPKKADRAIIMHDGRNVFCDADSAFNKSWRAIDVLKAAGITNTAIIGVDCSAARDDDYLPFPTELEQYGMPVSGGKTADYADYIEQALVPYLDKRFKFGFYGMLGSSAGATATLYFAARNNARFRAYGMFSTPLFVSYNAFTEFFKREKFSPDAYYYVYAGGNERTDEVPDPEITAKVPQLFVDDAFTIANALRKNDVTALRLRLENTNAHDELAWREPEKEFFVDFSKL